MTIDWPMDATTGEVFDSAWLEAGTRADLTEAQLQRVVRAVASGGTDPTPDLPITAAERREYWRFKKITQHASIMAVRLADPARRAAGNVRGADCTEWSDHNDLLKRQGHYTLALEIAYECADAAERVEALGEHAPVHSWYRRAAILLRKMTDYDSEVRLLKQVTAERPTYTDLSERLVKARELASKQR